MESAPCEPEAPEPVARATVRGVKGVSDTWATTPSVPWPKRGEPKLEGVRYHEDKGDERTYWLCNDGKHR